MAALKGQGHDGTYKKFIRVDIGGRPYSAMMDTGTTWTNVMSLDLYERLGGRLEDLSNGSAVKWGPLTWTEVSA